MLNDAVWPGRSVTVTGDCEVKEYRPFRTTVVGRAVPPVPSMRRPGYPPSTHVALEMLCRTTVVSMVPAAPLLPPTDALRPVVGHRTGPPGVDDVVEEPEASVVAVALVERDVADVEVVVDDAVPDEHPARSAANRITAVIAGTARDPVSAGSLSAVDD